MVYELGATSYGLSSGLGGVLAGGVSALPGLGVGLGLSIKKIIDRNRMNASTRRVGEANTILDQYQNVNYANPKVSLSDLYNARTQSDKALSYDPGKKWMEPLKQSSGLYDKQAELNNAIQGLNFNNYASGIPPTGNDAISPAARIYQGMRSKDPSEQTKWYDAANLSFGAESANKARSKIQGDNRNMFNLGISNNDVYQGGVEYPSFNLPSILFPHSSGIDQRPMQEYMGIYGMPGGGNTMINNSYPASQMSQFSPISTLLPYLQLQQPMNPLQMFMGGDFYGY